MIKTVIAKLNRGISMSWLVLNGFKYQSAKQYLKLKKGSQDPVQLKAIMRALPFNNAYDKLLNDILSTRMLLQERSDCFVTPYALVMELDGQKKVCPLPGSSFEMTKEMQTLIALLRNKGAVLVRESKNMYPISFQVWRFEGERYYIDDTEMSEQAMYQAANELPPDTVISEYIAPASDYNIAQPMLHLILTKEKYGNTRIIDEYITATNGNDGLRVAPQAADERVVAAHEFADYVSRKFFELPYMHLSILLGENRFVLMQFDTGRDLPYCKKLPDEVLRLLEQMQHSKSSSSRQMKEKVYRYYTSWQAKRKGFVDFMYRNWLRGLKEDKKVRCTTRQEKRWAHQRGFYSYRIKQYHLTEENYREILSDYDYKRLRPLNCRYHKWLWDKLMAYFVLWPFRDYLPTYYYRIVPAGDGVTVVPYQVQTQCCTPADITALLRQTGKLALKPAVSSHGEGFCKLEFIDGAYFINDRKQTADELEQLLGSLKSVHIVSEYVEMHHELKQIYDKVASTIRVMTIQNGAAPAIKDAYFRIGTSFTGHTDNLGSGGIAVPIDLETGRLGHAELLVDHEFRPCDVHPDTGALIQGQLPHWEEVKTAIEEIAAYLLPLEYLGFDIVITEDGFRILEINTHQDLHKYVNYPQEVKDYFTAKMAQKR